MGAYKVIGVDANYRAEMLNATFTHPIQDMAHGRQAADMFCKARGWEACVLFIGNTLAVGGPSSDARKHLMNGATIALARVAN